MNHRKSLLYILLAALGVILTYNYLIAPLLMQYNTGMGMGMHRYMYAANNYYVDVRFILLIAVGVAVLLLFELLKPKSKNNRCTGCGREIENDRWKICPVCGTPVTEHKKG